MGSRQFSITNCEGIYPVKENYAEVLPNFILHGIFIVYDNTIIFEDSKMHNFMIEIKDLEKVIFYIGNTTWAEFQVNDNSSFPMNTVCVKRIFVNVRNTLYSKDMVALCERIGEDKIERISEKFESINEMFLRNEWLNYKIFERTQDQNIFTGYLDFELFEDEYEMFMEYCMISMFNQIRNKAFVSYSQFSDIWKTAQTSIRSLEEPSEKTKLILVSGIPGSGKTTLGLSLSKLFNIENISSSTFIMPVKNSTKFSSEEFLKGLFEHCAKHASSTVVAVLPSYHHLKKAIFEFKKESLFNDTFELDYVITRVSAKNFYRHKNRNTYQFLLENCLKGICDVIIFEKGGVELTEFQSMRKQICEVNDSENILNTKGRTFEYKELADILKRKNNKYSLLYGKYFYGFEKEGRSSYYLENAVQGAYFNFKIPLKVDVLNKRLHKVFNNPIEDPRDLVPEEEKICDFENKVDSTQAIEVEQEDLDREETGTERHQRFQKKKEEREEKIFQADLAQEKMLIEEMKKIKSAMKSETLVMERIKGLFIPQGDEDQGDYKLISNFTEIKIKSCKNTDERLKEEELGFLVYGKNITHAIFKKLINSFRTQLRSLVPLRTFESATPQETKMLEEKYFKECLPSNFFHDGYTYIDDDGKRQYQHPNLKKLTDMFIEEENSRIADYNRGVQKEWKLDEEKYS
jgi:flagellar biosynthesis GTPase FlhF